MGLPAGSKLTLQELENRVDECTGASTAEDKRTAQQKARLANIVGVMGFSAGGWIVLALGADPDAATRPDFVAAIYPAMPPDLKAPANAPPLFLTVAMDDPYVPLDSLKAYAAWQAVKAPAELHAYATGGHGFALKTQGLPVSTWTDRFVDWMKWAGFLGKP